SNAEIRTIFTIPETTPVGSYTVTVVSNGTSGNGFTTVPGGGPPSASTTFGVFVLAPRVTGISPSIGVVGKTVRVTISGSNFGSHPNVNAGSNIGVSVSSASNTQIVADFVINANAALGDRSVSVSTQGGSSSGKFTVVSINLSAMRMIHNTASGELPETEEESIGAFLPANTDDDDYDVLNSPDVQQSGPVTGEDDLLPIVIHAIQPSEIGGSYTLSIPQGMKIWRNSNHSESADGTTQFAANAETTLFVEGITKGSGILSVNWTGSNQTISDCDRVKVNVFIWLGPVNVPGFSVHTYLAGGALPTSKWVDSSTGVIKTGAGTSAASIFWSEGPDSTGINGRAVYEVNANYVWDLEVNVVGIKIENPPSDPPFEHKGRILSVG
ncbi:MAG: IPT/TIG domain-containing protein, partial [Pyrinomonadaceae bacterium]